MTTVAASGAIHAADGQFSGHVRSEVVVLDLAEDLFHPAELARLRHGGVSAREARDWKAAGVGRIDAMIEWSKQDWDPSGGQQLVEQGWPGPDAFNEFGNPPVRLPLERPHLNALERCDDSGSSRGQAQVKTRSWSSAPVYVMAHAGPGLPGFQAVGLPDEAQRECRDRVRAAILSSGFRWPMKRITVNVTPTAGQRSDSRSDAAVAVAILRASGQVAGDAEEGEVWGELGLDGSIRDLAE